MSAKSASPKTPFAAPGLKSWEATRFPRAWLWFFDEAVPQWVKDTLSPDARWKGKPFSPEDARFFFKGIEELSELFTDDRRQSRAMSQYFQLAKFRSAYLLYFLPLHAAKFLTLFQQHEAALEAALAHGKREGALRILDLGSGPGTASIALLLELLRRNEVKPGELTVPIELHWVDLQSKTMEDGRALVEKLVLSFPALRGRVSVQLQVAPWWEARPKGPAALTLAGNVLNESGIPPKLNEPASQGLTAFMAQIGGGGALFLEPALKSAAQTLSRLRDGWIEHGLLPAEGPLWGPCLHSGRCPLVSGRDWCHFSVPAQIPGKWFVKFSEGLGSERQWVKFSYLWTAHKDAKPLAHDPNLRRVVSDPIRKPGQRGFVLLCEPEQVAHAPASTRLQAGPWRGDLVDLTALAGGPPRLADAKKPLPQKVPAGSLSGASGHGRTGKAGKKR